MCYGYSMVMAITCFYNEDIAAIGCFHHRSIHYHVPMGPLEGLTPEETAVMIMARPDRAAQGIVMQFNSLTPETRERFVQREEHDTDNSHHGK